MDKLPNSLLLEILSRLDDSAEVARCRVASKRFNSVFPGLRSINIRFSRKWYYRSRSQKPFRTVFLNLITKLKTVESISIDINKLILLNVTENDVFNLTDEAFGKRWIPRVSGSLKSLSISGELARNALPLISSYCHNLVNLTLEFVTVYNVSPMPMLTSFTLSSSDVDDELIDEMNKCFPNLQVLELSDLEGLVNPKISLVNLKTCVLYVRLYLASLTLITPNLITLKLECCKPAALHVDAPMLSDFYLGFNPITPMDSTVKKFENLKTLCLVSTYVGSLLSEFPITKTVKDLTVTSGNWVHRESQLTLRKLFAVFPNVSSLCIKPGAWLELEACLNPGDWEILDGGKELKTISAFLVLADPLLTFSLLARLLDKCISLSEASLLIHVNVTGPVSESFRSKCIDRWPGLRWRWGIWNKQMKITWMT